MDQGPAGVATLMTTAVLTSGPGWTAITVRCGHDHAAPLRPLAETLWAVAAKDGAIVRTRAFVEALHVLLRSVRSDAAGRPSPAVAGLAVLRLLDAAFPGPVLWVVMDVHCADAATTAALDHAAGRVEDHAVVLVTTGLPPGQR